MRQYPAEGLRRASDPIGAEELLDKNRPDNGDCILDAHHPALRVNAKIIFDDEFRGPNFKLHHGHQEIFLRSLEPNLIQ